LLSYLIINIKVGIYLKNSNHFDQLSIEEINELIKAEKNPENKLDFNDI